MARVMSRTTRPIAQVMTLKEALARLAAVPPQSFTRERGRLVAQLQKAGDDKAAAHVKARRAPTLSGSSTGSPLKSRVVSMR